MTNLSELFGSMVFNERAMRHYLTPEAFDALRRTVDAGAQMDLSTADAVADGMRTWALENGATHYAHWFQPHTGFTAEKHESFLTPNGDGGVLMEFSGKTLIRGEADGSSFPSGGLRATFEARGYTAWDPSSYAFIKGNVLCIPTAFCSYGGHALDKKTPLLRSMTALNTQAQRVLKFFGTKCGSVYSTVGLEQEYFLVDRERYNKRKDLIYTGHTLFGARPPKGQEMDDHYYGALKIRVADFMQDLNDELWKLGIPAKTEHNEVAPAQHELAPVFAKCNIAVDHNQMMMEVMKKVARRHSLTCLLHEKPFAGINGSGKHNNWGLSTDTGINLLSPGKTQEENVRFLLFVCAVIRAVDEYQDLLRYSVSCASNDNRLGGFEAPPAIISMFLGEDLEAFLTSYAGHPDYASRATQMLKLGAGAVLDIPRDNTDRNRTSPFAFTGNKFEFRSLGSSMSAADCNTVLNTIVAESLRVFAERMEGAEDIQAAVDALILETMRDHSRIIFSGNDYSEEWIAEATRRGLSNYPSSAETIPHLMDEKNVELFERHHVMSRTEMAAVMDILLENYCKQINIDACVMSEMVRRDILPAVIGYGRGLAETIDAKGRAGGGSAAFPCAAETELLHDVSTLCDELHCRRQALDAVTAETAQIEPLTERALAYRNTVMPQMSRVRETADALEDIVSKEAWPYPSYGNLLYRV
ncbi:MAG: glutamine synthetase III [Oscillospiraceae bacterium]|nr:glutamine synthetase III [Oscillospiraceae bacterium]